MAHRDLPAAILSFVRARLTDPAGLPTAAEITSHVGISRPTVNRALLRLVATGRLERIGRGPRTAYRPVAAPQTADTSPGSPDTARVAQPAAAAPARRPEAQALHDALTRPLTSRTPVSYERAFVDEYVPNESMLLPPGLAEALYRDGRAHGQQPAGTVARKVLEQLLIDLSWHSSRLEGNRKSLLDTRELFAVGRAAAHDLDATMLLNHKDAIEFLVEAVPEQGITVPVIRNLHSVLMQGLMEDPAAPGAIRRKIVTIDGSVYLPSQVPSLLEEMLDGIVAKARQIRNPLEGAFFLWVNIAYLQPFEDGNKRTSRLCANLPLLLHNCAPLSFLDVDFSDYVHAMLGVYEQRNVALAVELFEATYRRSIDQYRAALTAFGTVDPIRTRYREQLIEVVCRVVGGEPFEDALGSLGLPAADQEAFTRTAREELGNLQVYNCARYRLAFPQVERWINAGRPGLH